MRKQLTWMKSRITYGLLFISVPMSLLRRKSVSYAALGIEKAFEGWDK